MSLGQRQNGKTVLYAKEIGATPKQVRRLGGVDKLRALEPHIRRVLLNSMKRVAP